MKTVKSLAAMLLLANLLTLFAYGGGISYDDAKDIALNLIYSKTSKKVSVDDTIMHSSSGDDLSSGKEYHVIRLKTKGWVIVSGEDSVEPILAYSSESSLGSVDSLPPAFIAWMENINNQIKQAKLLDKDNNTSLEKRWEKLTVNPKDFILTTSNEADAASTAKEPLLTSEEDLIPATAHTIAAAGTVMKPLLTSAWGQGDPYNDQCPGWSWSRLDQTDVGCDATAMAQIMNYHLWPSTGMGTKKYTSEGDAGSFSLDVNFGNTTYNWTNMSKADKAKISYHAGVSVEMDYGYKSSAASIVDIADALRKHFRYNSGNLESKDGPLMSDSWWHMLIKDDIDNRRPIMYRGSGSGPHGFVCDGYFDDDGSNKEYHFNWGWYGTANGWFYIDNLNPKDYNYTSKQWAIFGISPKKPIPTAPTSITASDGTSTDGIWLGSYSVSGATYYKAYRSTSSTGQKWYVGWTDRQTTVRDPKTEVGKVYYYSMAACNSHGCSGHSAHNSGWRAAIPVPTAIPAPTTIFASDGIYSSGVVIGSYYVSGATHFKIYRATSAGSDKRYLGLTQNLSYKDTMAWPGTEYYYFVKACNSSGCSGYSGYNTGWKASLLPSKPITISATDGSLTSGVVIGSYSVSKASHYKIYRTASVYGTKRYLGLTYATSYKDTTAWPGAKYYYFVKACNSYGCSGYSAYNTGQRATIPAPASPTSVSATDGTLTSGVVIGSYYVSKATHYKIYRASSAGGSKKYLGLSYSASYKDTTGWPGYKYYYFVKACKGGECSAYSAYNVGWEAKQALSAPTTIFASDGTYSSGVVIGSYYVSGATHYKIYRASSAGGSKKYLGLSYSASYKDTTGWPGYKYYYFVKACKGGECSTYSAYNVGMKKK